MAATGEERDVEALDERLQALERERFEEARRANAAVAAAQDRAYWLERWQLDLNAVMRRPGMGQLRGLLRAARWLVRAARAARERLRA
jgi:hypothetical protein